MRKIIPEFIFLLTKPNFDDVIKLPSCRTSFDGAIEQAKIYSGGENTVYFYQSDNPSLVYNEKGLVVSDT